MPSSSSRRRITQFGASTESSSDIEWVTKRVLAFVKAAPQPSIKYQETVCVAGITDRGEWIRLYPLNFFKLPKHRKFSKYQWIKVKVKKHKSDIRPESYKPEIGSIQPEEKIDTRGNGWQKRKKILLPLESDSLETIQNMYKKDRTSLGLFKPKRIDDLTVEKTSSEWSAQKQAKIKQARLFGPQNMDLQKMSHTFYYHFTCDHDQCKGHKLSIIDWELERLYADAREKYGLAMDKILEHVKGRFFGSMTNPERDTYLIVGTRYPYSSFMVLGVFWPPK